MPSSERANLILGLSAVIVGLGIAFVWVPADVDTGLIEKVRRQVAIGDAFAPTIAASFIVLGGSLVALFESPSNARHITPANLGFLAVLLLTIGVSFAIMRYLGPAIAEVLTDDGYRPLRDTVPWKYIGFLAGGAGMIASLISLIEGRLTRRAVLVGLGAAIALVAIYDLPFDDLLLPPNGDV